MASSNLTVFEAGGSVDSGEVWSVHSVDWEISSDETDSRETLGDRVGSSPIGHCTHRRLARRDEPEAEDSEEEDPEEDPMEEEPMEDEDPEEDPLEEEPMEDEDPEDPMEEEPMEDEDPA